MFSVCLVNPLRTEIMALMSNLNRRTRDKSFKCLKVPFLKYVGLHQTLDVEGTFILADNPDVKGTFSETVRKALYCIYLLKLKGLF